MEQIIHNIRGDIKMYFRKGRYRFVFVFPWLGIAVKFPIIRLLETTRLVFSRIARRKFKDLVFDWSISAHPEECHIFAGPKNRLFGGIMANWSEFLFFTKTKNPFLVPTLFSFFGLFNIQKSGNPCPLRPNTFFSQLDKLTDGDIYVDVHHFANPDNFCFYDGRLRMLDYGSKTTHEVVRKYGEKILASFGPIE